jgi:hypothetical protein
LAGPGATKSIEIRTPVYWLKKSQLFIMLSN